MARKTMNVQKNQAHLIKETDIPIFDKNDVDLTKVDKSQFMLI